MTQSSRPEPSIEDLREESERARQDLANTVEELREKVGETATELRTMVSPSHIKREIKNYVRDERESLIRSVQRRARENPLQAAAAGAALAYPAWGLLRAIPAPLLLIGAGLFLTSSRGRSTANKVKDKVDEALQQGSEKVTDLAAAIQSDLDDRIAGARYGVEEARDAVTSGVDAIVSNAGSIADKGRAAFRDAAGVVTSTMGGAADKAKAAASGLSTNASEAAASARDRVTSAGANSRNAVTAFVNDNPLLVAGIGAAVGAFIAASIPPSEAENRMFGAGSDALKDKASAAAAQGIEKAGDVAADAVGSAAAAAAREGLDTAGVRRALNTVADGVRAVAERGVDTALGTTSSQSNGTYTNQRNAS